MIFEKLVFSENQTSQLYSLRIRLVELLLTEFGEFSLNMEASKVLRLEKGVDAVEYFDTIIQRLVERLLLRTDHLLHRFALLPDFWEYVAHRVGQDIHEFVEKRLVEAERAAISHRAAQ